MAHPFALNLISTNIDYPLFRDRCQQFVVVICYSPQVAIMAKVVAVRAKNEALPVDVAKLLRANAISLDPSKFCVLDLDEIALNFREFLLDLCDLTARPTSALLQAAGKLAFEGASSQELKMFGDRLAGCVSHCRKKVTGSTSGAKLSPAVKAIGTKVKAVGGAEELDPSIALDRRSLGQQLFSRARHLQRRKSEEEELRPSPVSSSAKKAKVDSNLDIMAMYGLHALPKSLVPGFSAQVCVSSDSEEPGDSPQRLSFRSNFAPSSCSTAPIRGPPSAQVQLQEQQVEAQYVDRSNCTLVRLMRSGDKIVAQMQKGPAGFLVGTFPGESQVFTSEIPNLMIDPPAQKLAVRKRPAGRFPKPPPEQEEPVEELEENEEEDEGNEAESENEDQEEDEEEPGDEAEPGDQEEPGDNSAPETVDYGESPVFFGKFLKICKSDKSGQSYILGGKPTSLKKDYKLVVAVSKRAAEAAGLDHKVVAQSLFDKLGQKEQFRKDYAVNLRDKALAC